MHTCTLILQFNLWLGTAFVLYNYIRFKFEPECRDNMAIHGTIFSSRKWVMERMNHAWSANKKNQSLDNYYYKNRQRIEGTANPS